jgi:D-galactarolactone cycloisomerase
MADSNHAYSLSEATKVGERLSELDYTWFEEPLAPQFTTQFRQLSDRITVPIAAGECEQTRWGFKSLMNEGGIQIAQPDLAYCGGPSEGLKIRALTSAMGVNLVPHAWGTMLKMACATHMLASTCVEPGRAEAPAPRLESDLTPNPMRDEMFSQALTIDGGSVTVPTAPGLGVEPDRQAIRSPKD